FAQGTDECVGATPLTLGAPMAFDTTAATLSAEIWPCAASTSPDLWFEYTTTIAGSDLSIETCGSSYDTALEIFSGTCGALVSEICNDDFCGLQSTAVLPATTLGTTYFIRVGGFGGSNSGFGTILASEGFAPPTPDCLTPDAFEDNDDCATASAIGDGTYAGLNVEELDNDYFAVTVLNGATLDVSLIFSNVFGDTDLYLWDPAIECDTNVVGTGGAYLVRGFSASDDEMITYTNASGADQNLIIEVDMFSAGGCNDYEMIVSGAGVSTGGIGSPYCMANVNSTGITSEILAIGSRTVADNDVTLTATGLPNNAFGFFIVSSTQGFVPMPGGSSGNLCVSGNVGRYVGPGQIQNSGATDTVSLAIDLQQIPSPTGFVGTMGGDTWNFQLWHRDSGMTGATSNFSNGTSVNFL
ncbi:MAG: hypothetical protein ACJA0P_000893, partial [Planctomycetota bacterium]